MLVTALASRIGYDNAAQIAKKALKNKTTLKVEALNTSDPSVSLLQSRISNNFSKRYCNAIQNGFSKDEAMKSAIIKTENIISFSYNPQKKWIEKDDLANQISLQVVNNCGWSFGLIGKEGVDYFKSYFLEMISAPLNTGVSFPIKDLQ